MGKREDEAIYTAEELIDVLVDDARRYAPGAYKSIRRNHHMNKIEHDTVIDLDVVKATIVDFINYIGMLRGLDVGLYTRDLDQNSEEIVNNNECRCCGSQLNIEDGYDADKKLCSKCNEETVPMVIQYLQDEGISL